MRKSVKAQHYSWKTEDFSQKQITSLAPNRKSWTKTNSQGDLRTFNTETIHQIIEINCNMEVFRSKIGNWRRQIIHLTDGHGNLTNSRTDILQVALNFYSSMYESRNTDTRKQYKQKQLERNKMHFPEWKVTRHLEKMK